MEVLPLASRPTDWIVLLMLGVATLVVVARSYDAARVQDFLKLPFTLKSKEWAAAFNPIQTRRIPDFLLSLSALLVLSLAVFFLKQASTGDWQRLGNWILYLRIVFLISLFFLLKALVGTLVASVFDVTDLIARVQNQYFAFVSWLLVPIAPVVFLGIFSAFWPQVFGYTLIVTIALGFLYALFQSTLSLIQIPPSWTYNIFYLCSLEIIPLIYLVVILESI